MNLWQECQGESSIAAISGTFCRLVESQQQVATLEYVDTLEEQAVLEDMLETVKPDYPYNLKLHYLLKSPFRYPPLPWGSRYGQQHEPSLLYGGLSEQVVLAESAYYRFVFWYSIQSAAVKPAIKTHHTLFTAAYQTAQGVQLQAPPFAEYQSQLTNVHSYAITHLLGTEMRRAGVKAFEYISARDPQEGTCVALFTPQALAEKNPQSIEQWFCETNAEVVAFKSANSQQVLAFPLTNFTVKGALPAPM